MVPNGGPASSSVIVSTNVWVIVVVITMGELVVITEVEGEFVGNVVFLLREALLGVFVGV